jgi:hypothetical protein
MMKFVPIALITASTIVSLIPFNAIAQDNLSLPEALPNEGQAGEFYITPECQVTKTQSSDNYRLDKQRFPLKIDGKDYQLYRGFFNDGSPIVCVSLRDLSQPEVVNVPKLQFLDLITPDSKKPNAFILQSREGNGMEVPVHHWGVQFKTTQPTITDLNILKQSGKIAKGQKATHRFNAKAGQPISIVLDSRAKAEFVVLNGKGVKVISGQKDKVSQGVSQASLSIPADGVYQVVISHPKGTPAGYTLSVNRNQIP